MNFELDMENFPKKIEIETRNSSCHSKKNLENEQNFERLKIIELFLFG